MPTESCNAPDANHVHHYGAIFSGRRIVVVAVEQELVHGRADLILRSLYKPETQILSVNTQCRKNSARVCLRGVAIMMALA